MTGHAVTYNLRHKRQGHLFQNRYKSIVVEEEPYFLELVRYIHRNPVRSGIVKDLGEPGSYRYSGHSVIMGQQDYEAQDVDEVLARFSSKRSRGITGYGKFVAEGFNQGRREELRGGGLIRSLGGIGAQIARDREERELTDERILGSGGFVETVLRESGSMFARRTLAIDDVLEEIAAKSGVSKEQILGESRARDISRARRQFFLIASERVGATLAMLARMTGRSHVAVAMAIEQARAERKGEDVTQ